MEDFAGNPAWYVLAIACAFASGWCLLGIALERMRRGRLVLTMEDSRSSDVARLLRKGVWFLLPVACSLYDIAWFRRMADEAVECLAVRGRFTTGIAITSIFLAAFFAISAAALLATRSLIGALAVPTCCAALAFAFVAAENDARGESLRESIPDALQSMGSCFQSGLSLLQTFHQVSSEVSGPLRKLFKRAAYRLETGGTVEESLSVLRESGSSELAFVAIALDVQHESGGSMKQVLEAARETVEGQVDLARELRVQTAQAKLSSRIVSLMPFILIALFSLISPDFLKPFFDGSTGIALLALALVMQLAGILLVRRMLAVEVR